MLNKRNNDFIERISISSITSITNSSISIDINYILHLFR